MQQDDLQQIKQIIEENNKNLATQESLDDLATTVKFGFEQIDKRFEQIDSRFEQVDQRFEDIYSRLDSIDAKLAFIQKEIEDIKGRLTDLEKRTIEDSDVFGSYIVDLTKRIQILETKVEQMTHG